MTCNVFNPTVKGRCHGPASALQSSSKHMIFLLHAAQGAKQHGRQAAGRLSSKSTAVVAHVGGAWLADALRLFDVCAGIDELWRLLGLCSLLGLSSPLFRKR